MGSSRGRLRGAALAIAAAALLMVLPVSSAAAATIPKGDYVCSYSAGYAGTVNIKGNNKYSVNDGKKGKYSFSRKTKILTFKSGDYKSFFGKYSKKSQGFDVFSKKSGNYGWTCYRD